MDWLGMAVRPRVPRAELKALVLARAYAAGHRRGRWLPLAAAAAVLVALGVTAGRAAWQVGRLRAVQDSLGVQAAALRDTLDLVRRPGVRVYHFPVVTASRGGSITIFTDNGTRRWLVTCNNLAPNTPGEAYQIWFVTDAGVRSALVMPMLDENPMIAAIPMPDAPVTGVVMTVEPDSGSARPSGPVVFKQNL